MNRFSLRTVVYILLDAFLLIVCFLHVPSIVQRPGAPFAVASGDSLVTIVRIIDSAAAPALRVGDFLKRWNSTLVRVPEAVEYLADTSPIGTVVSVDVERDSGMFSAEIRLIPYYESLRFLAISLFVGLTLFGVGIFILLSRPQDVAARALHWALVTMGATTMITWGLAVPGQVETYVARIIWFVTYLGVAVSFFFFTLVFPRIRFPKLSAHLWSLVFIVLALGAAFAYAHLSAIESGTPESIQTFQSFFDIFHVSLFVFIGGGIFNIARATTRALTGEERKKMYWVLWSLALGAFPYLVFHILPQVVFSVYIIPEEFTTIFFLAVPVGFAIAVLKYRLFDVEVLINRTIVYAVLTCFIVVGYGLVVLLLVSVIGAEFVFDRYLIVAASTLVIGLAVNPLRLRLQHVVDEVLFAARANYRRVLTGAVDKLRQSLNRDDLFRQLAVAVDGVIRGRLVATYSFEGSRLLLRASLGVEPPADVAMVEAVRKLLVAQRMLVRGKATRLEQGRTDHTHDDWLAAHGWSVCAPLVSETSDLLGVLVLEPHHAGEHYEEEEITFVMNVCAEAALMLERLSLQEKIILAQEEQRRSEELSELKSYFISSVSHELRTPLTSIRMFAEMLRSKVVTSPRRQREYLEIIEGESDRLSRLIGNILDFAKIERGVKEYNFAPVDVAEVARRSSKAMQYQFVQHGGKLRTHIPKRLPVIEADRDALEEAILNLLSNALKYSIKRKEVDLNVEVHKRKIEITVSDKGIGIPESELPHIYDRFYRVRDARTRQVGGAGLGLALVKHIVEAHGGTLMVRSVVGQGSSFTIELPRHRHQRRNDQ